MKLPNFKNLMYAKRDSDEIVMFELFFMKNWMLKANFT